MVFGQIFVSVFVVFLSPVSALSGNPRIGRDGSSSSQKRARYYYSLISRNYNYYQATYDSIKSVVGIARYSRVYSGVNTLTSKYYSQYFSFVRKPAFVVYQHRTHREISVCRNYEANDNGSYLGIFTCPLPFEPDSFAYCCGVSNAEYCCPFESSPHNVIGAVLLSVFFVCPLVCIFYRLQRWCRKDARQQRAIRKLWRDTIEKVIGRRVSLLSFGFSQQFEDNMSEDDRRISITSSISTSTTSSGKSISTRCSEGTITHTIQKNTADDFRKKKSQSTKTKCFETDKERIQTTAKNTQIWVEKTRPEKKSSFSRIATVVHSLQRRAPRVDILQPEVEKTYTLDNAKGSVNFHDFSLPDHSEMTSRTPNEQDAALEYGSAHQLGDLHPQVTKSGDCSNCPVVPHSRESNGSLTLFTVSSQDVPCGAIKCPGLNRVAIHLPEACTVGDDTVEIQEIRGRWI